MKKLSLALCLALLSNIALADSHGKSKGAHVHGTIKVEMAVEGKTIEMDIDGPAESFVGFEYAPKTAKEKKAWSDAETLWTKNLLAKLFVIDPKLGCKITEASFKQEMDEDDHKEEHKEAGVHSDINASAKVTCAQDLKGKELSVNLKQHYPHIKKLAVDLVGSETKTIDINGNTQIIKL